MVGQTDKEFHYVKHVGNNRETKHDSSFGYIIVVLLSMSAYYVGCAIMLLLIYEYISCQYQRDNIIIVNVDVAM